MQENKHTRDYPAIMRVAIEELRLTDAFVERSREMGFSTLGEMADVGWGELHKVRGFGYDWFDELVKFLDTRGLLHYLERG